MGIDGDLMQLLKTRAEAIARGLPRYFTGKPCQRGHVAERKTSGGNCVERSAILAAFLITAALGGCATNPAGSDWMAADFNKYDSNYAAFPTNRLTVGMPRSELAAIFGKNLRQVEANQNREVLAVDRWASVQGPDHVNSRLLLTVRDNKLSSWSVERNTLNVKNVNPSW